MAGDGTTGATEPPKRDARAGLPSVTSVLNDDRIPPLISMIGHRLTKEWIRREIDQLRDNCGGDSTTPAPSESERSVLRDRVVQSVVRRAAVQECRTIAPVLNATGVILHTGLGRAPLSSAAISAMTEAAGYCNLEIDLETGERTERGMALAERFQALTGSEDALVVNNNAAATVLTLQALAQGREVLLSRGQMLEIGGSFRLPEIFTASGANLREIGTTNRTRLSDYERAITPNTAAILRVHPSNYRIIGFTESPGISELAVLGKDRGIPVIDDIGSGALSPLPKCEGTEPEPSFLESLAAGADLVLGSGDKLLGGPQAGIILGRADLVRTLRRHPLARAFRLDKFRLAALAATVQIYLKKAEDTEIPLRRLFLASVESLHVRAEQVVRNLADLAYLKFQVERDVAPIGGGAIPESPTATAVITLSRPGCSAERLAGELRTGRIRLFPRIRGEKVLIDFRSLFAEQDALVELAIREANFRPT